jgi:hypothetical protein
VGTTASGATFSAFSELLTVEPTGIVSVGSPTTTGSFIAPGGMRVKGDVNLAGGEMLVEQTLTIDPTGDFNFTGGTLRAVDVAGSLQNDGGILAPGFITPAVGTISVSGNYVQAAGGTLQLEFGSLSTSFDTLETAGAVTLDGTLEVLLRDRVPQAGETFEIITASGGRTGTFQNLSLPDLGGDLEWEVMYGSNSVTLKVSGELVGLQSDYNGDGAANAADYVVWRKIDGSQSGYDFWHTQFAQTAGGGMASGTTPEPATILLFVIAAATIAWRRGGPRRG